jgi:hypothetical protein
MRLFIPKAIFYIVVLKILNPYLQQLQIEKQRGSGIVILNQEKQTNNQLIRRE